MVELSFGTTQLTTEIIAVLRSVGTLADVFTGCITIVISACDQKVTDK